MVRVIMRVQRAWEQPAIPGKHTLSGMASSRWHTSPCEASSVIGDHVWLGVDVAGRRNGHGRYTQQLMEVTLLVESSEHSVEHLAGAAVTSSGTTNGRGK